MIPHANLPNTKWTGTSATRNDIAVVRTPDGYDWNRLVAEFLELQDLALLRSTNAVSSSLITNLTAETDFDVTATLPVLKAGDVVKIRARGICPATHSTDTLAIKLYIGNLLLATIDATNVTNGDEFVIDADVFVLSTAAIQAITKVSTLASPDSWTFTEVGIASSALDSSVATLVKASATWSVADVGNTVKLTQLVVELKRGT